MDVLKKYQKAMIIPLIIGSSLLLWYKFSSDFTEKVLIIYIFVVILVPYGINLFVMLLNMGINNNKPKNTTNYNGKTKATTKNTDNKKATSTNTVKSKGTKVNLSPFYPQLRTVLTTCSKERLLTREDVLNFKVAVDDRLGTHRYVYEKFDFKNDMHEIYTKIKSSKLKDEDFQYLINIINGIVGENTTEGGI